MEIGYYKNCHGGNRSCEEQIYWRVLYIVIGIIGLEVGGGIFSGSLALLADAGHVFSDGLACLAAIVVVRLIKQGKFTDLRLRSIGAYFQASLLFVIAFLIMAAAGDRFLKPSNVVSLPMMVVAVLGAVGNWWQHRILEQSQEYNLTVTGLKLHVHSDFLQSVGVIIAGILIYFTGYSWWDPVTSFVIGIRIMFNGGKLLKTASEAS